MNNVALNMRAGFEFDLASPYGAFDPPLHLYDFCLDLSGDLTTRPDRYVGRSHISVYNAINLQRPVGNDRTIYLHVRADD